MVEGLLRSTAFDTFDTAATGVGSEFVGRCQTCREVKVVIMGGVEISCRMSSDVMFVVCVLVMYGVCGLSCNRSAWVVVR